MDDGKVYMPPKPVPQFPQPPCAPPPPGPGCCEPPPYNWPTTDCPPPPPKPPAPNCFPHKPGPGLYQIPPIPAVEEGQSLYEAMNAQIQRTNACIAQWNAISRNCFEAMNACVEAARSNDVYYDDCEVHYQQGFDENEGCAYAIVEKKSVDRQGRPIFVRLVPAYKNTTNSGVKQDIFDVSFIESANLIITAVPTDQTTWYGPSMYKGAPIPGTNQYIVHPIEGQDPMPPLANPGWVYGFNRQGWLRFFPAKDVTETDLCQNGMVDVLGSCWPILSDNELTEVAQGLTSKASITAIGFNKGTGSVFFFSCSVQDQPGMTGVSVAKLLQGFGCTTAVITSMLPASDTVNAGGMLYMGQMCTVPNAGHTPENLAYWVISKRPNFNNRFQKEIADLVQTTGQNAWKNYLLGVQIQDFDDRINENAQKIKDEQDRAIQAEQWLQENINKEVNRAMQAEAWLQENINKEVERATAEEARLDKKIDDETARAENAEAELNQKIIDETNRATAAENQLAADIAAEKLRAITRENEIQAALDKEIRERISADNDIINALEQEVLARRAADTALENKIDAVRNELKIDINNLNNVVNGIAGGQTELPYLKLTGGTLTGPLALSENNTVTLGRGPTEAMEAATKQYVDDAVKAGGGGGTGGDVSKEYVDQQITNLQTQVTGKVSKAGDSMTGSLNMQGNQIQNAVLSSNTGTTLDNGAGGPGTLTNLADPINPTDAVNLQSLEKKVEDAKGDLAGEFLPLTGGNMSGDINMTQDSVINFYDPEAVQAVMEKSAVTPSSTVESLRPSAVAKRLGITSELIADALQRGVELQEASVANVLEATGQDARAVVGQALKGSVYNDADDMCMSSAQGGIGLKGTKVTISDGAGNNIPVTGVSDIGPQGEKAITFKETSTDILGPVNVTNTTGQPNGTLNAGKAVVGGTTLEPHTTGSDTHLDIDVPSSKGAVYINRSNNGQSVDGGTGELHVTEIHSPQQMILRPGTSLSMSSHRITALSDGMADSDAVNLSQLKEVEAKIGGIGNVDKIQSQIIIANGPGNVELNKPAGTVYMTVKIYWIDSDYEAAMVCWKGDSITAYFHGATSSLQAAKIYSTRITLSQNGEFMIQLDFYGAKKADSSQETPNKTLAEQIADVLPAGYTEYTMLNEGGSTTVGATANSYYFIMYNSTRVTGHTGLNLTDIPTTETYKQIGLNRLYYKKNASGAPTFRFTLSISNDDDIYHMKVYYKY